jgi:ABC-type antimicrobial peptide transport system permease subunit
MTYVFRTKDDPHGIGLPLRAVLHRLAPALPTPAVRSMEELIGERLSAARFQAQLLGTFAITALGLTLVGIFAVLGYAVSRRTREFGVRIALGASRTGIVTGVLRRSLTCAAAGVLIGTTAAWGLTRLLQDVLFGIGSADPLMFLAVAGLLFLGAAGAAVIPARRASQVDPVIALRSD